MLLASRHKKILDILNRQGNVKVTDLASYFGVSEVTARRDLDMLADQSYLVRVRGGALSNKPGTSYEPVYETKSVECIEEKRRIGAAAAALVKDGETLILDSGSTTWHVGTCLPGKSDLTVITTDLKIAILLANYSDMHVFITGGAVRPHLFSCYGQSSENFVKKLNVNKFFLGADAIDARRGITNAMFEEAPIKKDMIKSAQEVILVVDHTKFNKISLAHITDFSGIDHIITDKKMPREFIKIFEKEDIKITIV